MTKNHNSYCQLLCGIFLLGLLLLPNVIEAQISQKGTPYGLNNTTVLSIPSETMPVLDVDALRVEDLEDERDNVPPRFGFSHLVNYNLENNGNWTKLSNGDRLWHFRLNTQEGLSVNLKFNEFFLPKGAKLFLYNETGTQVLGAYTAENNKRSRKFSTNLVKDNHLIIEYYEPANVAEQGVLNIGTVVQGYRYIRPPYKAFGDSGPCNIDTECDQGNGWENQSASVGMYIIDGERWCTGTLINNASQDCTPYFLTAEHCVGFLGVGPGDDVDWVFMFNYDSPTCSPVADGPTDQTVQGANFKTVGADSDFALFELDDAPQDFYEVYYSGWNRESTPLTSGAGISHPAGDVKKIAIENNDAFSSQWAGGLSDTHWEVVWDEGTTEGGSSGSALFNQNGQIVGQLTGGGAGCNGTDINGDSDLYGKIAYSWEAGNTADSRLKDWLDPNNTGVMFVDGLNCSMSAPNPNITASNTTLCLDITNTIDFTDLSGPNPTGWFWTFDGGTPSMSFEANPSVTYDTEGTYSIFLQVENEFGSESLSLTDYITIVSGENCPCITPTDVAATVTANDATISWSAGSAIGATWTVEYGEVGFTPGTGTVISTMGNSVDINDLPFTTGFDYYVTEGCDIAGESQASMAQQFFTDCDPNGLTCAITLNLTDSYGDGWNGAFLTVTAGGQTETFTIPDGFGGDAATYTFSTCEDNNLVIEYSSGGFENEVTYEILDYEGNALLSDGPFPNTGTIFEGTFLCSEPVLCAAEAGDLPAETSMICADASISVSVENSVIPDNFVQGYVLHDSPINEPDEIFAFGPGNEFALSNFGGLPGIYYITAVTGVPGVSADFPDLEDECTVFSNAHQVIFTAAITAEYTTSLNDDGTTFNVLVVANGGLPELDGSLYQVTVGETVYEVENILFVENIALTEDGIYTVNIGDNANCDLMVSQLISTTLPVQLLNFEGRAETAGNVLEWITASELNSDYFTLYASKDGEAYTKIATVDGAGTTNLSQTYRFLHEDNIEDLTYYRLSQTDFDGQTSWVGTAKVQRKSWTFEINGISPVPTTNVATIEFTHTNNTTIQLQLTDITGRVISQANVTTQQGWNTYNLDMSRFSTGTYFLSLNDGQQQLTQKIVKQ